MTWFHQLSMSFDIGITKIWAGLVFASSKVCWWRFSLFEDFKSEIPNSPESWYNSIVRWLNSTSSFDFFKSIGVIGIVELMWEMNVLHRDWGTRKFVFLCWRHQFRPVKIFMGSVFPCLLIIILQVHTNHQIIPTGLHIRVSFLLLTNEAIKFDSLSLKNY